jgi:hypothetical protein
MMDKPKIQLGDDGEFMYPVDRSNAPPSRQRNNRLSWIWKSSLAALLLLLGLALIIGGAGHLFLGH